MTDRRVFMATVVFLGIGLLTSIAGIIGLAVQGKPVPGVLETLVSGLATGLIGLLVRGPADSPQPVVVHQPENQPVPVEDAGHSDVLTLLVAVVLVVLLLVLVGVL